MRLPTGVRSILISSVLSLSLAGACSRAPAGGAAATSPATDPNAVQPVASHAAPLASGGQAEGTVLETMDASQYTYVRVKTATGEIWAATSTFKVAVGDRVVVPLDGAMQNFHSATLNRDFPLIYFAPSITHAGEEAALPPGHAPAGAAPAPVQVTEPIPPAPGGISVANLWANRKALAGKTVTLRGKVVKFNGGILGLNWTHIQDGSGVAKDGTNDITLTSATAEARVGDVITVTGTVVLDKDFGAGYAYAVMLQNATITVK
jgi:hypothetical protein